MDNKVSFNVGYLFLKRIYGKLNLNDICKKIQEEYKFEFDLNEVLSYLVFARIIYPSSKLETFKQCQNFIEQPKFKLHNEYRTLNYIAENMDFIQEQLFNNSKNIIKRNSKIIYYDCTNYFFEIDEEDDLKNMAFLKNIDLIQLLEWDCLWMGMVFLYHLTFIQVIKMNKNFNT